MRQYKIVTEALVNVHSSNPLYEQTVDELTTEEASKLLNVRKDESTQVDMVDDSMTAQDFTAETSDHILSESGDKESDQPQPLSLSM